MIKKIAGSLPRMLACYLFDEEEESAGTDSRLNLLKRKTLLPLILHVNLYVYILFVILIHFVKTEEINVGGGSDLL